MSSFVTEELIARQSPEAQAIIRLLLAEIQELKSQLLDVKSQLLKLTPQNSSLPPSSQPAAADTRSRFHPRANRPASVVGSRDIRVISGC